MENGVRNRIAAATKSEATLSGRKRVYNGMPKIAFTVIDASGGK